MNQKESQRNTKRPAARDRQHEMIGVVFLLAAAIVLLSLASFTPQDPVFEGMGRKAANLVGLVGAYLADGLLFTLGIASFLLVATLLYGAMVAFSRGGVPLSFKKLSGYLILTVLGTVLCHMIFRGKEFFGHAPGGVVGEYGAGLFISLLSTTGSAVMVAAGMILSLIEVTGFSPAKTLQATGKGLSKACRVLGRGTLYAGRYLAAFAGWSLRAARKETVELLDSLRHQRHVLKAPATKVEPELDPIGFDFHPAAQPVEAGPIQNTSHLSLTASGELGRREPLVVTSDLKPAAEQTVLEHPAKRSFRNINRDQEPEIVIPRQLEKEEAAALSDAQPRPVFNLSDYKYPDLSMLETKEQVQAVIEKDRLHEYARRLEEKLADYGVQGRVTTIMPGPVVTMYEYAPAPGVKVSKISGLSNDLALALEAMSVRIVAPIPGRAVVGIEVANKERQIVYVKEIIGHPTFQRSRSKLTIALGKNIEGAPYVTDLNKMPHLLVAGATGTGKSVALNAMITSILYRATPEDVRFILVDPKVLELSLYEDIPHLLLPVVTDPRKAQAALNWAVCEMDRRIHLLHEAGVRSLDSYNKKAEQARWHPAQAEEESPEQEAKNKKIIVIDNTASISDPPPMFDDQEEQPATGSFENADEGDRPTLTKLPHIVIVIDELADLMMSSSREVEWAIARIAQKARAIGIHLIIATQRPSVNVITGLIKANLPARISFQVASKTDSRTILDQNGAETLLGSGDMLFHPPTSSQIVRIHGALITEEEITRVVEHLKAQAQPVYDESILASAEENEDGELEDDNGCDELYDEAVQLVAEMGQASTSMIQRKLRIGYNRAARIVERMEREGIIGPPDGSRPREVLIQDHLL